MTICMFLLSRKGLPQHEWLKRADEVGFYVQEHGGKFLFCKEGVEFTMPLKYQDFLKLQFPELKEIALCY